MRVYLPAATTAEVLTLPRRTGMPERARVAAELQRTRERRVLGRRQRGAQPTGAALQNHRQAADEGTAARESAREMQGTQEKGHADRLRTAGEEAIRTKTGQEGNCQACQGQQEEVSVVTIAANRLGVRVRVAAAAALAGLCLLVLASAARAQGPHWQLQSRAVPTYL